MSMLEELDRTIGRMVRRWAAKVSGEPQPRLLEIRRDILEQVAGRWVLELLGLPSEAAVGFTSGATMGADAGRSLRCLFLMDRQPAQPCALDGIMHAGR